MAGSDTPEDSWQLNIPVEGGELGTHLFDGCRGEAWLDASGGEIVLHPLQADAGERRRGGQRQGLVSSVAVDRERDAQVGAVIQEMYEWRCT